MPLTTHREGLLRAGSLLCLCAIYNRGVAQHVVFDRFGLAQPRECSSKAVTCHANSTVSASGPQQHIICTEDVTAVRRIAKATHVFSGLDCIFHVEQPPE